MFPIRSSLPLLARLLLTVAVLLIIPMRTGVSAADARPTTTADPAIEVAHLDLLLDPLTKDEILVEATGWRDLVKAKVREISEGEIATRIKNKELVEAQTQAKEEAAIAEAVAQEQAAAVAQSAPQAEAAEPAPEPPPAPEESEEVVKKQEEKQEFLADLNVLREEKAALLVRFRTVLDAYEEKGGDAAEFRKYATAVTGIKVEVTDTNAVRSALTGWLFSKEGGIKWSQRALTFLMIVGIFWIVAVAIGFNLGLLVRRSRMSTLMKDFVPKAVRRIIVFIGLIVGLSTLGVNVSAVLALIGGGAFILGFALQETLGNFASGLMLLFYRPFDLGDVVEVGGILGKVDQMRLVNTRIRTFDNKVILIPNKQVWGQVITNATASDERRVDMVFGVGYDDDVDKAQQVLQQVVAANSLVLKEPAPVIELHELADSSVNFICRPWVKTQDYWQVYWSITREVKKEFAKAGLTIPYPQRDVHVYQAGKQA